MKKILFSILIIASIFIFLSIFESQKKSMNQNLQQASALQSVLKSNHLDSEEFILRTKEPNMTTIDVRTPQEYSSGHIEGAINIDFYSSDFTDKLKALDNQKAYSIYCRSGARSAKALEMMSELGFTNVVDLSRGYSSL